MSYSINSLQSTRPIGRQCFGRPIGRVLWEELLLLSRFDSWLLADKWIFVPWNEFMGHKISRNQAGAIHDLLLFEILM